MSGPDYEAVWSQARRLVAARDRAGLLALLDDTDEARRESAVWGVGQLRDPRDLPRLGELLADLYVNDAAEGALKDFGAAAEPVLLVALDRPGGAGVLQALEALRALGGADAVEPIARRLDQGDAIERQWAIEALSDIGERGAPAAWVALRAHAAVETDPEVIDLLDVVLPKPRGDSGAP